MRSAVAMALALGATLGACRGSDPSARPEPKGVAIAGIVEEAHDAPPYTYVRVRTSDGTTWAAVPLASVQTGTQIRIVNGVAVKNFDAPGLARKFDSIFFGVVQR
jgi:hypothetical protein